MIIRFSVENCLSFKERVSLEMFASRQRNLPHQLWFSKSRHIPNILKPAFVFGANASGKSNLIKAIHLAQSLVLGDRNPLKNRAIFFKLCAECPEKPSIFEFEFLLAPKKIYRFGFALKESVFVQEWLYQRNSSGEFLLYERTFSAKDKNQIRFGEKKPAAVDEQFLDFILRGTPENRLFLSEMVARNVDDFKEVYDWFKRIIVIYPKSELLSYGLLLDNNSLLAEYNRLLGLCDLGVDKIKLEKVDFEELERKLPQGYLNNIPQDRDLELSLRMNERYSISFSKKGNEAHKISVIHVIPESGKEVEFTIHEESDGTNRLFDLIPLLVLLNLDPIILIDELDSSLHPNLSKALVENIFEIGQNNMAQFIATTHDSTLLDVNLLRRDAIWFMIKKNNMASALYPLTDYKPVRKDKALQKAYLDGLYGAVPRFREE